jgi:hypothetical protein
MKKLVSILASAIILSVTNAMASPHPAPTMPYDIGYRHGKNDAFHTVATVAVVTGILVAAGIVIYQASDSRWGVSENGITYKF